MTLGGIRIPPTAAGEDTPYGQFLVIVSLKHRRQCNGPQLATAAPLIPHMAANMAQMTQVPMANPPLTGPNQRYIIS